MAFITISNLNPAGSDLLAGSESFLTELQETDTLQIFGGGCSKNKGSKKNSKGGYPSYPPYYPCPPCYPCH